MKNRFDKKLHCTMTKDDLSFLHIMQLTLGKQIGKVPNSSKLLRSVIDFVRCHDMEFTKFYLESEKNAETPKFYSEENLI